MLIKSCHAIWRSLSRLPALGGGSISPASPAATRLARHENDSPSDVTAFNQHFPSARLAFSCVFGPRRKAQCEYASKTGLEARIEPYRITLSVNNAQAARLSEANLSVTVSAASDDDAGRSDDTGAGGGKDIGDDGTGSVDISGSGDGMGGPVDGGDIGGMSDTDNGDGAGNDIGSGTGSDAGGADIDANTGSQLPLAAEDTSLVRIVLPVFFVWGLCATGVPRRVHRRHRWPPNLIKLNKRQELARKISLGKRGVLHCTVSDGPFPTPPRAPCRTASARAAVWRLPLCVHVCAVAAAPCHDACSNGHRHAPIAPPAVAARPCRAVCRSAGRHCALTHMPALCRAAGVAVPLPARLARPG
jgi:hypothetical protein